MTDQQQVYLWSEVNFSGTQYPYLPTPEMVKPEGLIKLRNIKQYRGADVKTFHVCYNRDYVVSYLTERVFKSLGALDYVELIDLVNESLKLREDLIAKTLREFGNIDEKIVV